MFSRLMIRFGIIFSAFGVVYPQHWAWRGICLAGMLFWFSDYLKEILYDRDDES